MKKKPLLGFAIFLLIGLIVGMIYWQSFLGKFAISMLKSNYGLEVNHEGLSFSFKGNVVCEQPKIVDLKNPQFNAFATANSLELGVKMQKAFSGKFEVDSLRSNKLEMQLKHLPNGSLHLAHVLQRFAPQATPQSAADDANVSATQPPEPEPEPSKSDEDKIPSIQVQNSKLNYTSQDDIQYTLQFGELNAIPERFALSFQQAQATRNEEDGPPLLQLNNLTIENVLKPGDKSLAVSGDGIDLQGHEIGQGEFDFKETLDVWKGIVDKVVAVFEKSKPKEQTDPSKVTIETMQLSDVSLALHSMKEESQAIQIHVDQADLQNGNELTLKNFRLDEANQPTLEVEHLMLSGILSESAPVEVVQIKNIQLNLREKSDQQLNIVQVIQRIQEAIDAFFLIGEKTASAEGKNRFLAGLQSVDIQDIQIRHTDRESVEKRIVSEKIDYNAEKKIAAATNFRLEGPNPDINQFQSANISAMLREKQSYGHLESLMVNQLNLKSERNLHGFTVEELFVPWIHIPKKFQQGIAKKKIAPPDSIFRIDNLKFQQAKVDILDVSGSRRVQLGFEPVNLAWNDVVFDPNANPLGGVNLNMAMVSPSTGNLTLQGQAATSIDKINADLKFNFASRDITGFQPYLENNIFQIKQGGLQAQGTIKMADNILDANLNATMLKPDFQVKHGQGLRLDRQAVITALNRLRDKEGNINLKNIHLRGNLKDPQFRFTSTFFDVLSRNLFKTLLTLPNLAKDVAGTGKTFVEEALKGIGSGAANLFKDVFGVGNQKNNGK